MPDCLESKLKPSRVGEPRARWVFKLQQRSENKYNLFACSFRSISNLTSAQQFIAFCVFQSLHYDATYKVRRSRLGWPKVASLQRSALASRFRGCRESSLSC